MSHRLFWKKIFSFFLSEVDDESMIARDLILDIFADIQNSPQMIILYILHAMKIVQCAFG